MPSRYDHLKITEEEIRHRSQGISFSGSTFKAVADFTYDWESWHRPDGHLIWVNFAVERLTGYHPRECLAMGDYPLPIVVPDDRERLAGTLAHALQRGSDNDIEFRVMHRKGHVLTMAISYQPIYGDQREHLGFRTSVRDITERCDMRDQIRQYALGLEELVEKRTRELRHSEAQRTRMERLAALGQLSARVAHEVNNPLAGIRNAFELIRNDLNPDHKHFRLFALIDAEIERISGIVHQMYQLYGRNPQQANHFNFLKTVEGVVTLLSGVAQRSGVSICCSPLDKASAFDVYFPEGELKQLVYNLIINAVQASNSSQKVTVTLGRDHDEVWFEVADEGVGIPSSVLPSIFDPFFSTKSEQGRSGMGLGLSVSRSLVESMNGRIDVQSEEGKGSRFRVVLPTNKL